MGLIIPLRSRNLQPAIIRTLPTGELGVDNIKTVVNVVVTFAVDIITILKDRNYIALLGVGTRLLAFGNIIAIAGEAWKEAKDVSYEESNDLSEYFAEVLDLENDETEEMIEYAVSLVPRVYEYILRALTFAGDVQAFYREVTDKFGVSRKLEKVAEKAKTENLAVAA